MWECVSMANHDEAQAILDAFAAHVREFHRSLPDSEKVLLEHVFSLAEHAMAGETEAEVAGFAQGFYQQGQAQQGKQGVSAGPPLLGPRLSQGIIAILIGL